MQYKSDNELIFEQYNKNIAQTILLESSNSVLVLTKYFNNFHNSNINDIHNINDIESKFNCSYFMFDSYRKAIDFNNYNKSILSDDKRYSLKIADDSEHQQFLVDYIFNNVSDLIDYLNENSDNIIKNIFYGHIYDYKHYIINRIGDKLGKDVADKIQLPEYYSKISCSPQSNKLTKNVAKICKDKTKSEIIDLLCQMFPYVVVVSDGFEIYSINFYKESKNRIEFLKNSDSLKLYSMNNSDDCGVMEGETGNCCWFIPNIKVFIDNFSKFMHEQIGWMYGNPNTPDSMSYEDYKHDAFNICSNFGLSHGKSIVVLRGNTHHEYGISDDEFAELFECVHHSINEAAPLIPIIARLAVRYGPKLLKMWLVYKARKYVADRSLRKQFEQIDAMDISDEEKLKLIKQQIQ